jgi:hypothetical protein
VSTAPSAHDVVTDARAWRDISDIAMWMSSVGKAGVARGHSWRNPERINAHIAERAIAPGNPGLMPFVGDSIESSRQCGE